MSTGNREFNSAQSRQRVDRNDARTQSLEPPDADTRVRRCADDSVDLAVSAARLGGVRPPLQPTASRRRLDSHPLRPIQITCVQVLAHGRMVQSWQNTHGTLFVSLDQVPADNFPAYFGPVAVLSRNHSPSSRQRSASFQAGPEIWLTISIIVNRGGRPLSRSSRRMSAC